MTTEGPAATLKCDKHKSQKMDLIDLVTLPGSDIKSDRDISANRRDQKGDDVLLRLPICCS